MATNPVIGITITGDSTDLVAAAKQASAAMNDLSAKTRAQFSRDAKAMGEEAAKGQRQAAWQSLQLYQQIQDFGVQLAGGQNPILALVQQGSQLTAIYGSAGAAIRAALGAIVSPAMVATAAVAALAYAFLKGDEQSAAFRRSLILTGNAAGLTEGAFNSLAETVSTATGASIGKVRELAQAMVTTGRFGSQALGQVTDMAVRMSALTGKSVEATVQDMVRMQEAPGAFAEEQNKQLNFLTDAQLQYIQRLEAFGKREEAVYAVREALAERLPAKVTQNLGLLESAAKGVTWVFSKMWDTVLGVGRELDMEDQIKAMERQRDLTLSIITNESNRERVKSQLNADIDAKRAELAKNQQEAKDKEAAATKARTDKEQRELNQRLAGQRYSLDQAYLEEETREKTREIELERVALAQQLAREQNPILQAYYKEQIAAKEVLAISRQIEATIEKIRLNNARPINRPEDGIDKRQRGLELTAQMRDLQRDRSRLEMESRAEVAGLRLKGPTDDLLALDRLLDVRNQAAAAIAQQTLGIDSLTRAQLFENQAAGQGALAQQALRMEREHLLLTESELAKQHAEQAKTGQSPEQTAQEVTQLTAALARLRTARLQGFTDQVRQNEALLAYERQQANSDTLADLAQQVLGINELTQAQRLENDVASQSVTIATKLRAERALAVLESRELGKIANELVDGRISAAQAEAQIGQVTNSIERLRTEQTRAQKRETDLLYDAQTGVNQAIRQWGQASQEAGRQAQSATSALIGALEDDLLNTFKSGQLSAKRFIDTLLNEFLRLQVIKPLMQNIMGDGSGAANFLSRMFGGGVPSNANTTIPMQAGGGYALGGAFERGVQAFAMGGAFTNRVVSQPTLFAMGGVPGRLGLMGEAGPEAIMPLQRDSRGRLGVSGGGSNVTVNIINSSGEQVETRESQGANGERTIEVLIGAVKDSIAGDLFSRTGNMTRAVRSAMA